MELRDPAIVGDSLYDRHRLSEPRAVAAVDDVHTVDVLEENRAAKGVTIGFAVIGASIGYLLLALGSAGF